MLRQVHFYRKGGKLPFAAVCTAVRIADKTDLGFFVFAHAAFVRSRGNDYLAVRQFSPKQPFKVVNRAKTQTDLSPHGA